MNWRLGIRYCLVFLFLLTAYGGVAWADTSYTVQPGDTLYLIGRRYGVSAEAIRVANNLPNSTIRVGQTLRIPTAGITYTVRPGDSLYSIARKYGVSVTALRAANGLTTTTIYPGQQLVIPGNNNPGNTGTTTYTVRPGDTLYTIGQRFGVPYREIMRANRLTSTTLQVGQVLVIPTQADRAGSADRSGSSRAPDTGGLTAKDMDLMARLVAAEAGGEPYKGQVGVAAVILNRIKSPSFPNTLSGVVFQPNAFESVSNGLIWRVTDLTLPTRAARDALNGWDPTYGALFFWNPAKPVSAWVWSRTITTQIGNHVFAI